MKWLIMIVFCILFPAYGSLYIGGSISHYQQQTPASDSVNADLNLSGNGVGVYFGYGMSFFAIEGIYKNLSAKAADDPKTFKTNTTFKGLGARIYLLSFFNFKFGSYVVDSKGDIKNSDSTLAEFDSTQTISYTGAGLRLHFGKVDVFVDYNVHTHEDDESDKFSLNFHETELGARFYF